jgi:hypothetical protein
MTSIDDIPTVSQVFDSFIAPYNHFPAQRASTPAFKSALSDLARAVKSGGDTRAAASKTLDVMPGKTERTTPAPYDRAQRLKDLPQTLRKIRANQGHAPGKGWKPNKATVKQWAKDLQNETTMDFSGTSTCFESLVWAAEPGESGPNAMGVMVGVFARSSAEYSWEVDRETALSWGSSSEGGWWNSDGRALGLYDSYLD